MFLVYMHQTLPYVLLLFIVWFSYGVAQVGMPLVLREPDKFRGTEDNG